MKLLAKLIKIRISVISL